MGQVADGEQQVLHLLVWWITAQDHISRRSTNVLLIDASVLMVYTIERLFHLRKQKQNKRCTSVTGIWCKWHFLILSPSALNEEIIWDTDLVCDELRLVSLQSGDGDGAQCSGLGLGESSEQRYGLGQESVLQCQQVHLNLGLILSALRSCEDLLLHLNHYLKSKKRSSSLKQLWFKWIQPQNYRWDESAQSD